MVARDRQVNIRVSQKELRMIKTIAEHNGTTVSGLIKKWVKWEWERYKIIVGPKAD